MDLVLGRDAVIGRLLDRLRAGHVFLVYGPYGIGKTTVLRQVARRLENRQYVYCTQSETMQQVVDGAAQAYPELPTVGRTVTQRSSALRSAMEREPAILLLDHWRGTGIAIPRVVRSILATGAGVAFAADVEHERDLVWLRSSGLTLYEYAIPPLSVKYMNRSLDAALAGLPQIKVRREDRRQLVTIARGRSGWITMMIERLHEPAYYRDGRLRTALLKTDVLMAVAASYVHDRKRGSPGKA